MALLESVILIDTRGSQPAANSVATGTLFCVTDEGNIIERSNGSTWDAYSPGFAGETVKIAFTIDGGGSAVSNTGLQKYVSCPLTGTISRVRVLADQSGDIVFDIWNDTWANRPPTVADTITASAKPTLSSGQFYEDTTLTGWTTAVAEGDLLGIAIDSVATLTWAVLEIFITPG